VRVPSMPAGIRRGRQKIKKAILATEAIARILEAAKADPERGVYYAFPFLTGARPSEQRGLLWEDVDFEANVVRIHRIQERDCSLTDMTKTEAGTREVPIGQTLRELLLAWRVRCPRLRGEPHRIFPASPGYSLGRSAGLVAVPSSIRTSAGASGSRYSTGSACPT